MLSTLGTPLTVQFCSRCTISNQRPRSTVTQRQAPDTARQPIDFIDGLCDGCRYQDLADHAIDWEARADELRELVRQVRSPSGHHDVVVPGSGGKDSVAVSHWLRGLGLHPITVTWAPMLYTDIGWRNMQAWRRAFANVLVQPPSDVHRSLCREATQRIPYPFQPFVAGQRTVGPKLAHQLGIPLVMYGECPAIYGGPVYETFNPIMDPDFYSGDPEITLAGMPWDELTKRYSAADLAMYQPLTPMEGNYVSCVYASYYRRWNPQEVYYEAAEHGFEAAPERTEGSYSRYSSIDDKFDPLHYLFTYAMFGLGRASYDSAHEIRNGIISREDGVRLVQSYDAEVPRKYMGECLEYLGMSEAELMLCLDSARPEHLWERVDGQWKLKHAVYERS